MAGGGGDTKVSNAPPRMAENAYWNYFTNQFGGQYPGVEEAIKGWQPTFFPGQTYAGMSPETQSGLAGLYGTTQPGGAFGQAQQYFGDVARGNYLGMNPAMQNAVMNPAMDAVASRFESMGRYGSPASQEQMAEAGMRALMPYYGQERTRQGQAAALLPQLGMQAAQTRMGVGGAREAWQQKGIDEAMQRYNFEQNLPVSRLQTLGGLLTPTGNYNVQTTNANAGVNPLAGALGGASMGAGIVGALGQGGMAVPGWGMPVALGLGALAGLLG